MGNLLRMVMPLMGVMLITISMGVLGFLAAIFITVLGAVGISAILGGMQNALNLTVVLLIAFAIARGMLRYFEQYSGHYIAFKTLALIRDKIYKALRRLAPAKLDDKSSGKLISIITADTEQLEVFYAHTIAPIIIAILTSAFMAFIIYTMSPLLSLIAVVSYLLVGLAVPYFTTIYSREHGREYRESVGGLNSVFLENLYGMREIILFHQEEARQELLNQKSQATNEKVEKIKEHHGFTKAVTETVILFMSMVMLFVGIYLTRAGELTFFQFLLTLICLMSSFGPTVALSNLSNNLLQTFASGERVLDLLEEKPILNDVVDGSNIHDTNISIKNLSFSYGGEMILDDISLNIPKNKITGIIGKSGSGKSTLLKLLMRFYDPAGGEILYGVDNLKNINTSSLREHISYVTQDTFLFNTTIAENIRIAKRDATEDEIITACKQASIHDFIMSLPNQYQSKVGELGDMLSGGEQQRIGIARAFLHQGDVILLDEPTSNLDSINEGIILNSLKAHCADKTIILVSHRQSTLGICDTIYKIDTGRIS